jgi:tetratricopeptide (TPR) repeat protein
MKTHITKLLLTLLLTTAMPALMHAQGITTPRTPSPGSTVSQTIGISTVTVKYSRPAVKGREVWGKLVPYGWNKETFGAGNLSPWRAGANENTVITFSNDATVQGKPVPAGTYGLFFVVNADNSGEVILSRDYQSWGNFWYDPAHDLMRAPIQLRDNSHTELLTYDFVNLNKTSGELVLNWEKKQLPVKIEFAVDAIVMANATEQLKGTVGFSWIGYNSAANYALQNKVNLEQGLKWADQAVTQNRNFNTVNTKAGLLRELGKVDEADKIIADALTTATEAEINVYGYQLLNQGKHDKAIEVLAMNTKKFPNSANAWDSLGEAYATKGDKANAIKHFKKSLTLNPAEGVKANSEKFLKQLGAM